MTQATTKTKQIQIKKTNRCISHRTGGLDLYAFLSEDLNELNIYSIKT